jgi:NAD(P)-dependent dehydrogenase (short-subunit alcohol dehydrogenase family)
MVNYAKVVDIMGKLEGKVAIITGIGSCSERAIGIGRVTALLFANEGAKIVGADYEVKSGEDTVRVISEEGNDAIFVPCDVSQTKDIQNLVEQAVKSYGRIDIVVNCAAIADNNVSLVDCPEDVFNRVIAVDLYGTWALMKYTIPQMITSGGGVVVNFASIAALEGFVGIPAYSAAKGGVISLSRVAAVEFASKNIRVNCVAPGFIATPLLIDCWSEDILQKFRDITPQRRLGQPEEIAKVVLFLVSNDSSHITGQTMLIDGGTSARVIS